MNRKVYQNFVRPVSPTESQQVLQKKSISGSEARQLYLEVVRETKEPKVTKSCSSVFDKRKRKRRSVESKVFCEKKLFLSVQNNDTDKLKQILNDYPDKLNILDPFGWSLLMIACQGNAVDAAKELLSRGIDTSIRDKADNSAYNLVIKNRNIALADLLLSHRTVLQNDIPTATQSHMEDYVCLNCNNKFPDKQKHLSSTLHNLNVSKGKKMPTNYVIPESNRGFQILLKGGWDKDSGLGPDGSGKKYPVKAVQKLDKTGLGHNKKMVKVLEEQKNSRLKNLSANNYDKNRQLEIRFRREFY